MCAIREKCINLPTRNPISRQMWIDSAKGVVILFVVGIHTVNGLKAPGIMHPSSMWDFFNDLNHTFQVPVFFFISGLFSERSYEKAGFWDFLKTKLELIGYPYVIWQTLQILLILLSGSSTTPATPELLLWFPIRPFMQFWFIYTLLMAFALYAVLRLAGLSSMAIFAISVGMLLLPTLEWTPFNDLCKSMIYLGFGLVLREYMAALNDVRSWVLLLAMVACFLGVGAGRLGRDHRHADATRGGNSRDRGLGILLGHHGPVGAVARDMPHRTTLP